MNTLEKEIYVYFSYSEDSPLTDNCTFPFPVPKQFAPFPLPENPRFPAIHSRHNPPVLPSLRVHPIRSFAMDAVTGQQQPQLSLAAVRDALIREEDSVVFALIERVRHPRNAPAYMPAAGGGRSLVEFFVREAEALQSKASLLLPSASARELLEPLC